MNTHIKVPYGECTVCGHHGEDCTGKVQRYRILRFFSDGRPPKRVRVVESIELARLHCNSPLTKGTLRSGVNYFDGFRAI